MSQGGEGGGSRVRLLPPSERGLSCTRTLVQALEDTELRPEVVHIVGVASAELSLDFRVLSCRLAPGARVVLIGPSGLASEAPREELLGPEVRSGLHVSLFLHTYQRYTVCFPTAEAPQFVALFHPGLDIHFFSWYPCVKLWADARVPVLVTAFEVPDGLGEKPGTVQKLLETLVGTGGGSGMWVCEVDNPHKVEGGSFNAGSFVFLGSQGVLPVRADDMYVPIYTALKAMDYPFGPRVGYLDVDQCGGDLRLIQPLLNAIGEGAVRGAGAHDAECGEELARDFAAIVLDTVLGDGAGEHWRRSASSRSCCENCGDGFDEATMHVALCPAAGREPLAAGDCVRLAHLSNGTLNGKTGQLERFDRNKQRWVVSLEGRSILCKAANIDKAPAGKK